MHFLTVTKILLLCSLAFVSAIPATQYNPRETGPQIAAYFRESLSPGAEVYLPNESNFTQENYITQRWNVYSEPTYAVAVKPATEGDIQKIVGSSPSEMTFVEYNKSSIYC